MLNGFEDKSPNRFLSRQNPRDLPQPQLERHGVPHAHRVPDPAQQDYAVVGLVGPTPPRLSQPLDRPVHSELLRPSTATTPRCGQGAEPCPVALARPSRKLPPVTSSITALQPPCVPRALPAE